jgi:hypothetical protein
MQRHGISRRVFIAGAAGIAAIAGTVPALGDIAGSSAATQRFLAARRHGARHEAVLLDARGHDAATLALPDRGHSFAIDAARARAVAFGRQPGFFAEAFGLEDCAAQGTLALPPDRHFFGHGVFSRDGALLFATENDFDAGRGVLGVYDAGSDGQWRRLDEIDTGGIGPHEVVLLNDGTTLCVANGGLLTHPDFGKTTLNLSTMRPSLAYIDAASGRLLEVARLPAGLFQLSIRHLAVDAAGTTWFACQHQGPSTEQPLLLGRHRRGTEPGLVAMPAAALRDLRNYIGSIAIDAERGIVAASSPVGGTVAFWDVASGQWLGSTRHPDGCGIAVLEHGRFLVSDGFGGIGITGPERREVELLPASREIAWDNHMRRA